MLGEEKQITRKNQHLLACMMLFMRLCNFQEKTEIYFISIFIAEAALKIIAQGFVIRKNAYLRDHWNKLDFALVILGYVRTII
jgi:hypothetical protein